MKGAWLEPIVRLCENLISMPDMDDSVRIRIVPATNEAIVEAVLPDGRVALRRVHSPEELERTMEALAVLPPAPVSREPPRPSAEPPEPPPPREVGAIIRGARGFQCPLEQRWSLEFRARRRMHLQGLAHLQAFGRRIGGYSP